MQADQIPAELVEAAAEAIRRVPGATFMNSRQAARAALTAVYPLLAANVLEGAASDIEHDLAAVYDKPIDDSAWDRHDAMAVLARWLRESAAALRTPDAGVGGGERG